MSGRRFAMAVTVVVLLGGGRAAAWTFTEHELIGRQGYVEACARLSDEVERRGEVDDGVRLRLRVACGNLPVVSALYGQSTGIAGDHLDDPQEFLERSGEKSMASRKNYLMLARVNSTHFHPSVTRKWRTHHIAAIDRAIAASQLEGTRMLAAFERAAYENAFADHFLQDSYAAGHMGFNRAGSSAGAALAMHDEWNERGRTLSNRTGQTWYAYGDGHLVDERNRDNKAMLLEVSTRSIYGFLYPFVFGERETEHELAIWELVPYTVVMPEIEVEVEEALRGHEIRTRERGFDPLLGTMHVARKDAVGEAWMWSAATFADADDPVLAAVAGFDLALPWLRLQSYVTAGGTLREPGGGHSIVLGAGGLRDLGLSAEGVLSHEVHAGVSWILGGEPEVVVQASYRLRAELGTYLLHVEVGPALVFPGTDVGYYVGLGGGYVFNAAGGGAR